MAARTAELQQALERAEAAARAKIQFLAVMSREIRTPMKGIILIDGFAATRAIRALPLGERPLYRGADRQRLQQRPRGLPAG